MLSLQVLLLLSLATFAAGFVDAIAGGGGLITLPALLAAGLPTHAALATNKGQATFGAFSSVASFWLKGAVDRRRAPLAFFGGFVGALAGSQAVLLVPPAPLKPIVLVLLVGAALFVLYPRKKLEVKPHHVSLWVALPIGLGMGFYDGFFGPGTGSLLIVLFVATFGDSLTAASANAKVNNFASNLGALLLFTLRGTVLFQVALPIAAANMLGAFIGARVALRGGDKFVRVVVVMVVIALLGKVAWDVFFST